MFWLHVFSLKLLEAALRPSVAVRVIVLEANTKDTDIFEVLEKHPVEMHTLIHIKTWSNKGM